MGASGMTESDRAFLPFYEHCSSSLWCQTENIEEKEQMKCYWSPGGDAYERENWKEEAKLSPSRRYCVTNQKWITADFTIRRLLPQSANIDAAKGIPACLTAGELWQSSPQTGQTDEDHNYSCWQANVLKVGLYNIFKRIILAGGSSSQNFELNEELNKIELNSIKDVIDC